MLKLFMQQNFISFNLPFIVLISHTQFIDLKKKNPNENAVEEKDGVFVMK